MRNRKLILIIMIIILLIIITGFSPTKRYWEEVEKASQDGLPRTAIKSLNKILEISQQRKDYCEWLRALFYKITLEASIQGSKPVS